MKAYVFFKGRSIVFKEQGEVLLLRLANDLEDVAKVESMPQLEGKKMNIMLAPKKSGNTGSGKKKEQALAQTPEPAKQAVTTTQPKADTTTTTEEEGA